MRQDAWRAYLEMALGLTEASRKKATKAVKRVLGKGGATAEQLQDLAEELLKTSAANREAMTKLVRYELDRALGRVGLATVEEVSDLTARVRQLEAELALARAARETDATPAVEPFDDDEGIRITEPVTEPAVAPVPEAGASEPLATVTPIASGAAAGARKAVAKKAVKKASPAKSASGSTPAATDITTAPAPAPAKKAAKKTAAKKAAPADGAPAGAEAIVSGAADAAPAKAADAAPAKGPDAADAAPAKAADAAPAKKAPGRKATTNRAPAKKAPPKKTPARRSDDGGAGT
jgi:polyhydroxyalkanoate synthesis regulator phasin